MTVSLHPGLQMGITALSGKLAACVTSNGLAFCAGSIGAAVVALGHRNWDKICLGGPT